MAATKRYGGNAAKVMNGRQLSILERETRDMAVRYVEISADKTMPRMFNESISGG